MAIRSNPRTSTRLLEEIWKRLNRMGVEAVSDSRTAPEHDPGNSFKSLRAQVHAQVRNAIDRGIDVNPHFEINERAIGIQAGQLAQRWHELNGELLEDDLYWTDLRPTQTNWQLKGWFKRVLLRRERQISDYFYLATRRIGKSQMPIVSDAVLRSKTKQNEEAARFARRHQFSTGVGDTKIIAPFAAAASNARKQASKYYVRAQGLEKFATKAGYVGFFVTLTLPGHYHTNPTRGRNTWQGATPEEGHDELQHLWRLVQRETHRRFGKTLGIRVAEPHQDGTPHFHLLIWVKPEHEEKLKKIISHFFGGKIAAKVEAIDHAKGKGASYIMKYILPVISASADTTAARYQAHRAAWGKRAIQFFDHRGASTLWDKFRRIKLDSGEYGLLSSYGRELHDAACSNDYCRFLCLLQQNTIPAASLAFGESGDGPKKRVSIWYGSYGSKAPQAAGVAAGPHYARPRSIQGLIDHGTHVDTHPHRWTIEPIADSPAAESPVKAKADSKANVKPMASSQDATVMHSYPRGGRWSRPSSHSSTATETSWPCPRTPPPRSAARPPRPIGTSFEATGSRRKPP